MIWLIVLAVWLIASVLWWHSMYKEYGFLRVSDIYQGIFASIPGGIVKLHEYLDINWGGWNYPLFMNKELKADIDFTNKEMDEHIKNAAKELMEEIDKEIAKNETGRKNGKVRKNAKKKN